MEREMTHCNAEEEKIERQLRSRKDRQYRLDRFAL
jgi:hypothetical protein